MTPLFIRPGLTIPGECMAVSFSRDMAGGDGPEVARSKPVSVELRFHLRACEVLSAEDKRRILRHPEVWVDRRDTLRIVVTEVASRSSNLELARSRLAALIREALDDRPKAPADGSEDEAPRPRRGRAGLLKKGARGEEED